jgi:Zn-dependent protease with chaperone function
MILPYALKLLASCAAVFFLVHGFLGFAAWSAAPMAIRFAERMPARQGARFLLLLRFFPLSFSVLVVAGICVPSYLLFEPRVYAEPMNLFCSGAALCGFGIWGVSISRSIYALVRSAEFARAAELAGRATPLPGDPALTVVLCDGPPIFGLCGIFRARVILSRDVRMALSPEEFEVALRHENAHRISSDNLKRLLILLAPEALPGLRCFARLERAWTKLSEWSADDDASRQDAQAPLLLAQALIQVARLGVGPRSRLSVSLVGGSNLEERVNRLLLMEPGNAIQSSLQVSLSWVGACAFGALLLLAMLPIILKVWPTIFYAMHVVLERMVG